MDDIYSAILAIAKDPEHGIRVFREISETLIDSIAHDPWKVLKRKIQEAAKLLSTLPRKCDLDEIPSVALIGEIYVRRDRFSRQRLVERISKQGFWVRTAPVAEWIRYCDYIVQHRLVAKSNLGDRLKNKVTCMVKNPFEDKIRNMFEGCGFYRVFDNDVDHLIDAAKDLISPRLTGGHPNCWGCSCGDCGERGGCAGSRPLRLHACPHIGGSGDQQAKYPQGQNCP